MNNRWELYSSMPGWEAVSERLDAALAETLKTLDASVANGMTLPDAATKAASAMGQVMHDPMNSHFGAEDTEPHYVMYGAIRKHVRERYGVHIDDF